MQRLDELCVKSIRFLAVDAVEEAGSDVRARLAVEAASPFGWERWTGEGDILGMDRFGASGSGPEVLAEYGYTVENVVARAVELLQRV